MTILKKKYFLLLCVMISFLNNAFNCTARRFPVDNMNEVLLVCFYMVLKLISPKEWEV
jgi:hypothetical protein